MWKAEFWVHRTLTSPLVCIPASKISLHKGITAGARAEALSSHHSTLDRKKARKHKDLFAFVLLEDFFALAIQLLTSTGYLWRSVCLIKQTNCGFVQVFGKSLLKSSWLPSFLSRYSNFYTFPGFTRMYLKDTIFCWILHLSLQLFNVSSCLLSYLQVFVSF